MDLYLKAPTEEDMITALTNSGVIDLEGMPTQDFSVDQIGPFVRDEIEYPDWHTNLRGNFTEEQLELLTPLLIEPTVPYRTWLS